MKRFFLILLLLSGITVSAQTPEWPKMKSLKLKEVRTVSDRKLVAFFLGPDMNEVSVTPSGWSLNGKQPEKLERWITPNWSGVEFGYEHHIYLTMNIKGLPAQRQWLDSRKNVSGNEFTIPESIAYPSVVYTILSGGGAWDRKTDPYVSSLE